MSRSRCCWFEEWQYDGMKLLCVRYGPRPSNAAEAFLAVADETVIVPEHLRPLIDGELMARCIEAVELVRQEQLPVVLQLFGEGFVVARW